MIICIKVFIVLASINVIINAQKICSSGGCRKAAKVILDNMDSTIDPCDDFYAFSCGGFIKKITVSEDEEQVSTLTKISDQLISDIKDLMTERTKRTDLPIFRKIKIFYKACINENKIEKLGLHPIKYILTQMGGWPVVEGESWTKTRQTYRWYTDAIKLRRLGFSANYFLDFSVETDPKNPTRKIITLNQPNVGILKSFLDDEFGDDFIKKYTQYMIDVAVLMGATKKNAERDMIKVFEFQKSLLNISLEEGSNLTDHYKLMKVKDLKHLDRCIVWKTYLNGMISNKNIHIGKDEEVLVYGHKYIKKLKKLILITPLRVQVNYMLWRTVEESLKYLNKKARNITDSFTNMLTGEEPEKDRTQTCYKIVDEFLQIGISSMYVRRYFPKELKYLSAKLVEQVKRQYIKSLREVSWMDFATKKRSYIKIEAMKGHIGFPSELLWDRVINKYYQGLKFFIKGKHFTNMLKLKFFHITKRYSSLRTNKDYSIKHAHVLTVNAFFSQSENALKIPAGIIRGIVFDKDQPNYINFAALGQIVGHEITHTFDLTGRTFNEKGKEENWWSNNTIKNFIDKEQCLIKQYNNYTHDDSGEPVDGTSLFNENMGDNVGVHVAYHAYLSFIKNKDKEGLLPGLNYTKKQLFWMSSANVWCSKTFPGSITSLFDIHAPSKYRVIGPLSNRPEFLKDFNCSPESPMNRADKCEII